MGGEALVRRVVRSAHPTNTFLSLCHRDTQSRWLALRLPSAAPHLRSKTTLRL